MRNIRLTAAVAVFAALMVLAVAGVGEAHQAPRFYVPRGYVQDVPLGVVDQFHQEDLVAMLEDEARHAAEHLAMMEAAGLPWGKHQTRLLTEEFGFPAEMTAIAGCESVHNPAAHRTSTGRTRADISGPFPTGDYGLWQINWKVWGEHLTGLGVIVVPADLFVPHINAEAAAVVLAEQGLRAWSACR